MNTFDKYKIIDNSKYSIIYTKDNLESAQFIKKNLEKFLNKNDKNFGYKFDEKIKIILVSNKSQIPNAFSTQIPFNMIVLWNGVTEENEYFANTSSIKTLLIHELIHNYQINAKKYPISQWVNKILGKNYKVISITLPNLFLPTAIIEGNAVLNESIYNNGGRLFNGSLNALKNSLIFNDKINPTSFINNHLYFPYLTEKYIVGGFYMKYLANMYGIERVNKFFYEHSAHYINPLLLSSTFKKHFGLPFQETISNFTSYTKKKYKNYKEEKIVNKISVSQDKVFLSKIEDKIYFISNNLINSKNIYIIDTNKNNYIKKITKLKNGAIFKIDNILYTATSYYTSQNTYKHGLFDEDGYILKSSSGKYINDIFKNKIAYIDIQKSFLKSKLYINKELYEEVASTAMFDKNGNIYYFKQKNKIRTLYKNKKEVFSFKGYFSSLMEIRNNQIFFIANTQNGSSLYKISNDKLFRLSKSDNIINARIINKNYAIVVTITSDGYVIHKIKLENIQVKSIFYEDVLKKESNKFIFNETIDEVKLKGKNYNEIKYLRFKSIDPIFSYHSQTGLESTIKLNFIDYLQYNSIDIQLTNYQKESFLRSSIFK